MVLMVALTPPSKPVTFTSFKCGVRSSRNFYTLTASYAMNASTNIGSVIYIKHKKSFQLGEEITMNNDRIHRSTI